MVSATVATRVAQHVSPATQHTPPFKGVLQRVVAELLQLAYCLSVAALRTVSTRKLISLAGRRCAGNRARPACRAFLYTAGIQSNC